MRSPKEMRTIQIDITNACIHQCSNCTRMCGHHKKNFFMDWNTFKAAVDSLKDYEGTIGIMGGEPTLHPEFERFVRYLGDNIGIKKEPTAFIKPASNFIHRLRNEEISKYEMYETTQGNRPKIPGAGLWSTITEKYFEFFELIQDTFRFQSINDHMFPSFHQPVLVTRKELGITDDEWIVLRDNCWVQNEWSATITPKGAFFCEIAGALDMLFDGPGGWPIEPGWWKREPDEFGQQLQWCELCGLALNTCSRNANDGIDDMSPVMYEKLKKQESPKLKSGKYRIFQVDEKGIIGEREFEQLRKFVYIDGYDYRVGQDNRHILPQKLVGTIIYDGQQKLKEFWEKILSKKQFFDELIIIDKTHTLDVDQNVNGIYVIQNEYVRKNATIGMALNLVINSVNKNDYIILMHSDMNGIENSILSWKKYVINPGTIIYSKDLTMLLFSPLAEALKKAGFPNVARVQTKSEFVSLWDPYKRVEYDASTFKEDEDEFTIGESYIIYGAGGGGKRIKKYLENKGCVIKCFSDTDCKKWGQKIGKNVILPPDEMINIRKNEKIVISTIYYGEIIPELIKKGIQREDIIISGAVL